MNELTEEQLVDGLALDGRSVTRAQLARWRRAGLLAPVTTRGLGRGSGTVTIYSSTDMERVNAITEELAFTRDLGVVGWRMWWLGFDAPESYWRPRLVKAARRWDRVLALFRLLEGVDALDRDDDYDDRRYDTRERVMEQLRSHSGTRVFRSIRKALQGSAFTAFVSLIIRVGAGTYVLENHSEEVTYELSVLDAALGFGNARCNYPQGSRPWLPRDYRPELAKLSQALASGPLLDPLQRASKAELRDCADQFRRLWLGIECFVKVCTAAYGSRAFGLHRLALMVADRSPETQAGLFVAWLHLRPILGAHAERFVSEHQLTIQIATDPGLDEFKASASRPRTTSKHYSPTF